MPTCELRYRNVALCSNATTEGEYYQVFTTRSWSYAAGSSLGVPITAIQTEKTGPEKVFICNKCLAASILNPIVSRAWHLGHVILIYFFVIIIPLSGLVSDSGIWGRPTQAVRFTLAAAVVLITSLTFIWGRHIVRRNRRQRVLLETVESGDKVAIDSVLSDHSEKSIETGDLLACAVACYKRDEESTVSSSRDNTIPDRANIGFETRTGTCWNGQNVLIIKKILNAEGED